MIFLREMIRQVALGLEHLHKKNIAHRDIKQDNILVSFPDETTGRSLMKLADFGLCCIVKRDGTESSLTKCGTVNWMAPELYGKNPLKQQAAFAADIFSLGCVFGYSFSDENQHPFGSGNMRGHRIENKQLMILQVRDFQRIGKPAFELVRNMVIFQADRRITIEQVLRHSFFVEENLEQRIGEWSLNDSDDAADSRTPLMLLCSQNGSFSNINRKKIGLYKDVEQLLKTTTTVEVNKKDFKGNNALFYLCENYFEDDLYDIIRLLIERGININEINTKNGFNALMILCVQYNHDKLVDIVRLFIENGINLNATSSDGWNVLHIICRYYNRENFIELVDLLIENGIEINAVTNENTFTALHILVQFYVGDDLLNIISSLIKHGIDINSKSKGGGHILSYVIRFHGNEKLIDILRLLIENGSDVKKMATRGSTPLTLACAEYKRENLIDIVTLLIDQGADVNTTITSESWNALMQLCRHYNQVNLIDIVHLLLEKGINVHGKSKNGTNALLCICQNRNHTSNCIVDVVSLLIEKNIDVNAVDGDKDNAVILLCKHHVNKCDNLITLIRLILDNSKIDVNHKNKEGLRAMNILRDRHGLPKESEVMRFLVDRGAVF